nr:hypothetical protein [Burkholderia oklahomensis]
MRAGEATEGGAGRHRRQCRQLGGGVLALAIATSIHVLAWLALERRPPSAADVSTPGASTSYVPKPERRALIVRLIPRSRPLPPPLLLPSPSPSLSARRAPAHAASMRGMRAAARAGVRSPPRRGGGDTLPDPVQAHAEANDAQWLPPQTPGATAAGANWRADLDSVGSFRSIGRGSAAAAVGAAGTSSGLALPRKETAASTLAREMSKASRADCRNAYSGMGLLAIPALAIDAVRDDGCKW